MGPVRALVTALSTVVLLLASQAPVLGASEGGMVEAKGDFSVDLTPQLGDEPAAGRLTMAKQYTGDLEATGSGQMISERIEEGESVYAAIEHVEGSLKGKRGSFTLFHTGSMSAEHRDLRVRIVDGSGTEDLVGISGEMEIIIDATGHHYVLNYEITAPR